MESMEQVKRGIAAFIDREIVPVMPKWKGILFAAGAPLVIEQKVKELPENPIAQALGVFDGDMVDVDKVYSAIKEKASGKWPVEISNFKMNEADLDKLYQYIKEA